MGFSRSSWSVLIYLSVLLASCAKNEANTLAPTTAYKPLQFTTHAISLVLHKILQDNPGCELLYLHGSGSNDSVSAYDFDLVKISQPSSGARTVALLSPNVAYARHEDIHRHSLRHCALGIFFFNSYDGTLQPWLFDTIIPRYAPILRKDEDEFIFIAPTSTVADEVLLSIKFGEKIKYKIALYVEEGQPQSVECKTVDFYANDGDPLLKTLRYFNAQDGNQVLGTTNLFPDMTKYFNGKRWRITVPNVKYRFEMEWRDGAFHPKRGFYKWWLVEAVRKFNFTYHMFWSSYGKATGKPVNGTWVGAAGDVLYDRADIAVIFGETYSRHAFFGFSAVLSYEWVFFMTHKPWNYYSPKAIFWPFTPLMWSLFFLSLIIMTFTLKAVTQFGTDPTSKTRGWTYGHMVDYIFTTFMEQDRDGPMQTSSIRMLCAFWLLYSMVLSNAYRGKLVSLIAFPIETWIPTTFEELAYSDFKVILNNVGKVGAAYDVLSSSTNPVFQTIFKKMEQIGQAELCLMKAMTEDASCIMWEGINVYVNARNLSDKFGYTPLVQSQDIPIFINDGFTFERRAIFKHHMDRTIEAALQMGLTIKWLELDKQFIRRDRLAWEASVNKTAVVYDRYEGPQKLILSQFSGLYSLCGVGIAISTFRFFMELWIHRREMKRSMSATRLIDHEDNGGEIEILPKAQVRIIPSVEDSIQTLTSE